LAELALTARIREASNGDRLAPTRISAVLALEVWQARAAPHPRRTHRLHPRVSVDQPGWGEDRIAEELAIKLGVKHSTSTIRRYMVRQRKPRGGQTWKTFVKNHASQMFAVDFLTHYTALFTVV
jgi:hypothetical protein